MSLTTWPRVCPTCGGTDFTELARIEANEFSAPCAVFPDGDPSIDRAIYGCECGHEWEQ